MNNWGDVIWCRGKREREIVVANRYKSTHTRHIANEWLAIQIVCFVLFFSWTDYSGMMMYHT